MTPSNSYDVIVLGAGAAGMMCAFEAGKRGRRVLLLDHGEKAGRKILISGGGRCNFTNTGTKAENFLSENPHFAKSALARYTPKDFIALVEKHGIRYHEKTLGQLFCDDSARLIVSMLERECAEAAVLTRCSVTIDAVRKTETGFALETSAGSFLCASLVVATGGLSIPKMGATAFGYELAKQFGHAVLEPRAGLVPLVFSVEDKDKWCDLAGLSTEVTGGAQTLTQTQTQTQTVRSQTSRQQRSSNGVRFREKLLITHRGISGPAALQVSSYWQQGGEVSFDLAPGREVFRPLTAQTAGRDWNAAYAELRTLLPTRMAERWVRIRANAGPGDWTNAGIARLEHDLHTWTLRPDGSEGFAKAEVTVGGITQTQTQPARSQISRQQRSSNGVRFREKLLITHRGISGPAALQVSSYWQQGGEVSFDLAPGREVFRPLTAQTAGRDWNAAYAELRTLLPTRMAERWVRIRANAGPGDWTNAGIARLEHDLHTWTLRPDGSEGFAKAEVTVGGIDTRELDARTMESKRTPGLYFIGEVVDVTGWLGGYNFQWAWASAAAAAQTA